MDEFINFRGHIDVLTKKLSKYVGLFFKLRHFLPGEALVTLYRRDGEIHRFVSVHPYEHLRCGCIDDRSVHRLKNPDELEMYRV